MLSGEEVGGKKFFFEGCDRRFGEVRSATWMPGNCLKVVRQKSTVLDNISDPLIYADMVGKMRLLPLLSTNAALIVAVGRF